MSTNDITQLIDASNKVYLQLNLLIETETEKRNALLNHNMDKIDALVQAQQSALMKLDSLEKKRHAAQNNAGFSNLTATQIVDQVEDHIKKQLKPVFDNLRFASDELKILNKASLEIANVELKLMGQTSQAINNDNNSLYNSIGKKGTFSTKGSSFHEKM